MPDAATQLARLQTDPRYHAVVSQRSRASAAMAAAMIAVYFGFVLLVAFDKPLLGRSAFGGATSIGILVGVGVILFAFLLTALYVRRANRVWDREIESVLADVRASGDAA